MSCLRGESCSVAVAEAGTRGCFKIRIHPYPKLEARRNKEPIGQLLKSWVAVKELHEVTITSPIVVTCKVT